MSRLGWLLSLGVVVGCGSSSLKHAGDSCSSTSECDKGLLCDVAATPHVCAGQSSIDAAVVADASPRDALPPDAGPIDAPRDAGGADAPRDAALDAALDAPLD